MRLERATGDVKGWYAGAWDSDSALSVGFANSGVDEPHVHSKITEIYLVARGSSTIRIEGETIELHEGDALFIAPGEAHTFLESSDSYFHFVVHTPGIAGDAISPEKRLVPPSRLGL